MKHVPMRFWLGLVSIVSIVSALAIAAISSPDDEMSVLLSVFMLVVGVIFIKYAVLVGWPAQREEAYERLLVYYTEADRTLRENVGWEVDYKLEDKNHNYGWVHLRRKRKL